MSLFEKKTICDSVHGSIGISALEQSVINSRTFQRLRKIKQLGFAHYVFPAAEHSRFSHSIGVMHVMSRMVDQLRRGGAFPQDEAGFQKEKQKLRLAALLHDIGHYPLAHLGEQVMQWVDSESQKGFEAKGYETTTRESVFHKSGYSHKSDRVKHERLGRAILGTEGSELRTILSTSGYDADEIARIFNAETTGNQFYTQLMSSTLDCDRLDYLLRDSAACGVKYGNIDLEYILSNMVWSEERVCFAPKAIHALEHFVTARYHYYNVAYHKTVRAFEVMAKALFYAMIKYPEFERQPDYPILSNFDEIKVRIPLDAEFLANYNDEYFWHYLERWRPPTDTLKALRLNLLNRAPIRVVAEEKTITDKGGAKARYDFLSGQVWHDEDFGTLLSEFELDVNALTPVTMKTTFEAVPSTIKYHEKDKFDDEDRLKLIKVLDNGAPQDLIAMEQSIVGILSHYEQRTVRIYALVDADTQRKLRARLAAFVDGRMSA